MLNVVKTQLLSLGYENTKSNEFKKGKYIFVIDLDKDLVDIDIYKRVFLGMVKVFYMSHKGWYKINIDNHIILSNDKWTMFMTQNSFIFESKNMRFEIDFNGG